MTRNPIIPEAPRGRCWTGETPDTDGEFSSAFWFELKPRTLTVEEVAALSPTLVRIRFSSDDDFDGFPTAGPEDHVKLFFDVDEAGAPVLPSMANGRWSPRGLTFRDYTIRWFDRDTRRLDVDFVLHDHGVAGRWAIDAAPGDRIGALGPRGAHVIADVFPWYVLAADETALPALARWVEGLRPGVPVTAYVEVDDEASHIPLPTEAELTVVWLHRSDPASPSTRLSDAVIAHDYPDLDGFVWVAGEALSIKPARRFIKSTGFDRDHWDVDGYWRRGVANLDHHQDDDEDETPGDAS
ncbi:siderophore-interacting protein [Mycetocola reblochoni]|uniref:Iron-chelator utilization protein n=2 Tax=Mycetocola reblochoni TaxID=331618 RepID=A0A1R4ICC8_9MICO|nr:siderophore-interacting protein [Mycetocola reblochoni]RLP69128.1 siderophore-interacting protein [Mycetocola reblochoni]SJN17492.1 iron-chelator utilization protein [Mycetocola reblochoni REB411]